MKPSKGRWRKVRVVLVVFSVIFVVAYAVGATITGITTAANAYSRNRQAAKDAGLWFTNDEVIRYFNVPPQENGLVDLALLIYVFRQLDLGSGLYDEKKFAESWAAIEPFLPQIKAAAEKTRFVARFDPHQPYDVDQEWSTVSRLIQLIVKESDILAKQGRSDGAQDLLLTAAALASHFRECPITYWQTISTLDLMESKIRDLIPTVAHDRKWLGVLDQAVVRLGVTHDLRNFVRFDHWLVLWESEILLGRSDRGSLRDLGWRDDDSKPSVYQAGKLIPRFATANLSRIHQHYVDIIRALPANPADFVGVRKAFHDKKPFADDRDYSYTLIQKVAEANYEYGILLELEAAQRNVLRQALKILIDGLDPRRGLPLKGFDALDVKGKPLNLVFEHGGWILYSVGPNRNDDHAAPPPTMIDDFIVHLSPKSIDPLEFTRTKRWGLGARGIQ